MALARFGIELGTMTIQQALQVALQHHQAGRLREAEALYGRILAVAPDHADAWNLLGTIAQQTGRPDLAVEWIQKAIALSPDFAGAYHMLGVALKNRGQVEDAIHAYRRAVELAPTLAEAHNDLGLALKEQGRIEEAIAACRRAIDLAPRFADAYDTLGAAMQQAGQWEEAVAAHVRAVELDPHFAEAFNNLGLALAALHRNAEAIAAYERALQINPQLAAVHYHLGNVFRDRLQFEHAVAAYRRALALDPQYAEACNNLGAILEEQRRLDEAVVALHRAIELRPGFAAAHCNLANVLRGQCLFDEAIAAARQSIALQPDLANAHNTMGNLLRERGELVEALEEYRRALALDDSRSDIHSNLIYAQHFHPAQDGATLAAEQQRWNERFSPPARPSFPFWRPSPETDRQLKIGYVSPDFREHVVGRNLLPLLAQHDHTQFEIICYSDARRADALTATLRGYADHWRETACESDEALAEIIRRDEVDILVDTAQHLANNRLPMFARAPAALQVSFAGYPASAGVNAITHRLSDRWMESAPSNRLLHEEVHLLESFWCYDSGELDIPVNVLPAKTNGWITFGCLNNFSKVNASLLHLWARVMCEIPHSRLVILGAQGSHRERAADLLARAGIESHRLDFVAPRPHREYLELYRRLDMVLDTAPYNGHTTSLDALWMGVPVVSLAGDTAVARAGLSQLSNLRLSKLVAYSADEYVAIASRLARDLSSLDQLRSTLRARMENSVLMDAPRFARQVEQIYRNIWRKWSTEKGGG